MNYFMLGYLILVKYIFYQNPIIDNSFYHKYYYHLIMNFINYYLIINLKYLYKFPNYLDFQ